MALTSTKMEYPVRSATMTAARPATTSRLDATSREAFAVLERDPAPAARRPLDVPREQAQRAMPRREAEPKPAEREARPEREAAAPRPADSASKAKRATESNAPSSGEATRPAPAPAKADAGPSPAVPQAVKVQAPAPNAAMGAPVTVQAQAAQEAGAVVGTPGETEDTEVSADETDGETSDKSALAEAPAVLPGLLIAPPPANAATIQARTGTFSPGAGEAAPAHVFGPSGSAAQQAAQQNVVPVVETDAKVASDGDASVGKAFEALAPVATASFGDFVAAAPTASASAPAANAVAPTPDSGAAPTQAQSAPVPLGAVPMTIGLRSLAGSNRFEIRLDPKDLGRIDVNLDIDKDNGTVTAHLVVDRPETLALLQRDAGNLQQALSQAGFDTGDTSINLSLRSDTGSDGRRGTEQEGGSGRGGPSGGPGSDLKDPRPSIDAMPLRMLRGLACIDIRI
ncbi:flagellar hook-length control protein FliK [Methylobacterium sp. 77]|uniref:flagellar hook-length control protein FliK n=1 Tax=Methylobacterium sp. 77 TaxID=1101192 RepID=UPI0003809811|nr:flagellar hook-length control protein FliK [Methylobacterium sp. 77]